MEKSLMLLPCCGNKQLGGTADYKHENAIVRYLPNDASSDLLSLRRELFDYFGNITQGFEVDSKCRLQQGLLYKDAFRRYSGPRSQLYSRISIETWIEAGNNENIDVIIISALYGILNYNESIQLYNRTMQWDKVNGVRLQTWWKNHGLPKVLRKYIEFNNITKVYSFLSKPYAEAVDLYNLGCYIQEFPELRSGNSTNAKRAKMFETLMTGTKELR